MEEKMALEENLGADRFPDAAATVCRFLEIPSEIRNRIYDFATEKTADELEQEILSSRTNDRLSYVRKADRRQGQFAGLTRACRQIRSEYLPLYNARNEFNVLPHELTQYLEIFVNPPGTKQEDITANLIVSGYSREHTAVIRMEPLMALTKKARSLNIRWCINGCRERIDLTSMLDAFLHLDKHPVLREYVERSVDKIEVQNAFKVNATVVVLWIKEGSWEDWMENWMQRYMVGEYDVLDFASDWVDRVQLPYGDDPFVAMLLRFARA